MTIIREITPITADIQSIRSSSAWKSLFMVLALFTLWLPLPADAVLKIDITKGGLQPLPIAVPHFVTLGSDDTPRKGDGLAQRIADVVMADLERSGLFKPIKRDAYLQDPVSLWRMQPSYRDWRLVGAEAVVAGAVKKQGNQVLVSFYLYDVFQGSLVGDGKRFSASMKNWRHVAHRVSDEIYSRLTGESSYFTSRISFIAQRGKKKWLAIMDSDGANRIDLTMGNALVLTPSFSPNGERLFYLSYETGEPRIFRWDLYTGRRFIQGNYPGLNSTPSWSPDGTRMAMTLSKDGNPEIYVKDLKSGRLKRLTRNNAIDTSPSWSPDGRRIVFNSDRGGSPQLYVMNVDGSNTHRISFDGKYNAAPAWSPRGDLIAYVKGGGGKFRIAVISPDGKRNRALTDSWMDESPTWSPNGRVILFSRQKGDHTRLYTIDLTGHNERLVPLGGNMDGSDPSWSTLIR
ncbi:MAG: Tol-Pal system protein TolB [Magnetococcales bacterium]|nr:Tol-Pal system protein TolB [Magnetococcales bacterium]